MCKNKEILYKAWRAGGFFCNAWHSFIGYAILNENLALNVGGDSRFHSKIYLAAGSDYYINENGSGKFLRIACGGADFDTSYSINATGDVNMSGNCYIRGNNVYMSGTNNPIVILKYNNKIAEVGNEYADELVLKGKTVSLKNSGGTTVSSDERLKNSFKALDEFDSVYMNLNPIAFKYNNGTSDRFHFGFGAKQIRDSFLNNGFSTKDFAGFVQTTDTPDNEDYCGVDDPMGLIYTEFVSWNTHMIQKTIQCVNELENTIKEQSNEIDILKAKNDELETKNSVLEAKIADIQAQMEVILNKLGAID